ncbi:MAG: hypothetical protein M3430_03105 [Acidobacteriota bacterium]|nr:hypothetical protein [Acidobacteriota bacterium]
MTQTQKHKDEEAARTQDRNMDVRLNYHSFSDADPTSTFVLLHSNGQAQTVRYSRYSTTVIAVHQGTLHQTEATRLLARVREALRREIPNKIEREFDDLFDLSLRDQSAADEKIIGGEIENAPEDVRALVEEMCSLWKRLEEVSPADAYIRSAPIAKDRLALLLRERKLRFTSPREFPPDLQPIVTDSISGPGDFRPLSRVQYNRLLAWRSHGYDFFVLDNSLGHQLTLYLTRKQTTPAPKGDSK